MVEGQPACPRGDRLDDAIAAENSRRSHLLSPSDAGGKPEGQCECESRERSHAAPLGALMIERARPIVLYSSPRRSARLKARPGGSWRRVAALGVGDQASFAWTL